MSPTSEPQASVEIRPLRDEDVEALYSIALRTGDAGTDATHLYRDGGLVGHVYAAPYARLRPQACYVAEDGEGVAGYIVGTFDTRSFEAELERLWWPGLREVYPLACLSDPSLPEADRLLIAQIHRPEVAPASVVASFPAHIHMNLLPRLRGKGTGSALLAKWFDRARQAGVRAVHLGASPRNDAGMRFWTARGFERLGPPLFPQDDGAVWFGQRL